MLVAGEDKEYVYQELVVDVVQLKVHPLYQLLEQFDEELGVFQRISLQLAADVHVIANSVIDLVKQDFGARIPADEICHQNDVLFQVRLESPRRVCFCEVVYLVCDAEYLSYRQPGVVYALLAF